MFPPFIIYNYNLLLSVLIIRINPAGTQVCSDIKKNAGQELKGQLPLIITCFTPHHNQPQFLSSLSISPAPSCMLK